MWCHSVPWSSFRAPHDVFIKGQKEHFFGSYIWGIIRHFVFFAMAHMLSPSWHFHKRVKWKTCQSVLTFSLPLKIVKFHTKCKTWQASHPANFKSGKFNPYPWKLVAYKCKKNYIYLFMSALVSQLLFFSCPGQLNRWPCQSVSR